MIGHYLLTLSPEQEDRVLTLVMQPGSYYPLVRGACLVGTALGYEAAQNTAENEFCNRRWPMRLGAAPAHLYTSVETRYDDFCARFGAYRINAAVRNRILANRARRVLGALMESAVV